MGTGSIGILGYDDDQAQVSWDAQTMFVSKTTPQTGTISTAITDCSRWNSTFVSSSLSAFQASVTLSWYSANTFLALMARRVVMLDSAVPNRTLYLIPNLGPWVSFALTPTDSIDPYNPNLFVFFTNRAHPLTAYPLYADLGRFSPSLAPSATVTQMCNNVWGGAASLVVNSGSTSVEVDVLYMGEDFVYHKAYSHQYTTPNTDDLVYMTLPLSPLMFSITNNSGGASNNSAVLRLLPNLSGV